MFCAADGQSVDTELILGKLHEAACCRREQNFGWDLQQLLQHPPQSSRTCLSHLFIHYHHT